MLLTTRTYYINTQEEAVREDVKEVFSLATGN